MKCVHCGQRKGKRKCPALGGDICPQCCGEHRLKTIACPSSCVHLGGLAVVAGAEVPDVEVEAAFEPALTALDQWYLEKKALLPYQSMLVRDVFRGQLPASQRELEALEEIMSVVAGCAVYAMVDHAGKRAVDHYLAAQSRDAPASTLRALKALSQARFGVFHIDGAVLGEGLTLRDVFDDAVVSVKHTPRDHLPAGAVLAGFLADSGKVVHPIAVAVLAEDDVAAVAAAYKEARASLAAKEDAVAATPATAVAACAALVVAVRGEHAVTDEHDPLWHELFDTAAQNAIAVLADTARADPEAWVREWLDTGSPLFEGKSPRDAAADPRLRRRVHYALDGVVERAALGAAQEARLAAALSLDESEVRYDPEVAPAPLSWLMLHARERHAAIRAHHKERPHAYAPGESEADHVAAHDRVERWVAQRQKGAGAQIDARRAQGVGRHDAVHELIVKGPAIL